MFWEAEYVVLHSHDTQNDAEHDSIRFGTVKITI